MRDPFGRCWVIDPPQLEALRNQQYVDPRIHRVAKGQWPDDQGSYLGRCKWPRGLYSLSGKAEVYFLNDSSSACWVRTSEGVVKAGGWDKVRSVNTSFSSLIHGREYKERC